MFIVKNETLNNLIVNLYSYLTIKLSLNAADLRNYSIAIDPQQLDVHHSLT